MYNRLVTREAENGNVILVAYGWLKLAEYDESRGVVTVFTGHKELESKTVSKYLNKVIDAAESRGRDVVITGESPVESQPNLGTRYINNYISFGDMSKVEKSVLDFVNESLAAV